MELSDDRRAGMGALDRIGSLELGLDAVRLELAAAISQHAEFNSPHEGHSVIREEMEELWEHVRADTGRSPEARTEAIQIAAMAVRYAAEVCSDATP